MSMSSKTPAKKIKTPVKTQRTLDQYFPRNGSKNILESTNTNEIHNSLNSKRKIESTDNGVNEGIKLMKVDEEVSHSTLNSKRKIESTDNGVNEGIKLIKVDEEVSHSTLNSKRKIESTDNGVNEGIKLIKVDEEVSHSSKTGNSQSDLLLDSKNVKKVSADSFKEIVYSLCHDDFLKPYNKLGWCKLPDCYNLQKCRALHEGIERPREVGSFEYGHIFSMLDNPLCDWACDVLPTISQALDPLQYLRGDMVRMLFDYILNGPNEQLMWEVKAVLESQWTIHPPCTDRMRNIYLELLDQRYHRESFFRTELSHCGVFTYVLDKLEIMLHSDIDVGEAEENEKKSDNDDKEDDKQSNLVRTELTFEVLEERFRNYQPLFEEEKQEMMNILDDMANSSQMCIDDEVKSLEDSEKLNRLTIALGVIIDLLEADFLICVSRLKSHMMGEGEFREPLLKHFMDETFQLKILKSYVAASVRSTWEALSRLIGLMAETIHLFQNWGAKVWNYPNISSDCEDFASLVFEWFQKGGWDEGERLARLQKLRPPWLQQRVALSVANSHLNLVLSSGIHAVVDIIHTHTISPVKLESNLKKIEPDPEKLKLRSEKFLKKAKKKNHWGETQLHLVCKGKKFTEEDVECLLALPDTDVNARDNNGWTPLHEAVNAQSVVKLQVLLQYQPPPGKDPVDVGAQNNDGITPLHEAVETSQLEVCKLLILYGGICLLRKKNNHGQTPLMLSKDKKDISNYFKSVIKTQEALNLNSNSVLKLSDFMIKLCMIISEAFISDHFTWELYQVVKFDKGYVPADPKPYLFAGNKEVLLEFKKDQDHFRKLRKILEKLAENPENSYLVRIWNDRYQYRHSTNKSFRIM